MTTSKQTVLAIVCAINYQLMINTLKRTEVKSYRNQTKCDSKMKCVSTMNED